ncbi:MAG TPA: riboflavin synthase [Woeseiaceae bacterium]|nr:riboflavin synthase [Woeseiaceae bacterium]
MFTGIIKAKGSIGAIEKRGGDVRLRVTTPELPWPDYEIGDSIAVNGVCLTAVRLLDNGFDTDVSVETLDVTTLKQLTVGDAVNLEPALRVGDALGGHLVSGHVDGIGRMIARADDARSIRMTFEVPGELSRYIAKKGSICVDGVSLTINEVSGNTFGLNIIPHTAEVTTMGAYEADTAVNIEVDLLARYIERMLGNDAGGLSIDFLREHGYA